jgi:hypothetical protein
LWYLTHKQAPEKASDVKKGGKKREKDHSKLRRLNRSVESGSLIGKGYTKTSYVCKMRRRGRFLPLNSTPLGPPNGGISRVPKPRRIEQKAKGREHAKSAADKKLYALQKLKISLLK